MIALVGMAGTWLSIRMTAQFFGVIQFELLDGLLALAVVFGFAGIVIDGFQTANNEQPQPEPIMEEPILPDGPRPGWVYVVKGPAGFYKIGRSKDPANRYETFRLNLPFQVEYEHLIACRDMSHAEAALHRLFARCRAVGTEWFKLSKDDLYVLKSIKEM